MNLDFSNISIRGRVAYAIICLENAIRFYEKENLDWLYIFNLLWAYTKDEVGNWHYPMAESTPKSIMFDADYSSKEMEYIDRDEYEKLSLLYKNSNNTINYIIDKLFEIGTRDLYSSIINNSPDTLKYLQEIIDVMEERGITLPNIKFFQKFPISENEGWGRKFLREDIFNENIG
ncbi:hypothetical protein [Aquimarina mytili]|uniref:Uncharacterized protein n=1 Tax=Aquimarina mytili TaxID=874423 RepID=A0A937D9Q3_9FLAO|nr:hypothetical protein [Aquimarina mytili]MBL0685270.1 hypothetical protein [Aquimarina mytili]